MQVDYSEKYENRQQDEIQSAYFGHTAFSIFTACCYFRKTGNASVQNVNIAIISEASDQSRIAAFSCVKMVLEYVTTTFKLEKSNV